MRDLITNEYYQLLVEDCKAIVTEAVFVSRWSLVEGYHTLGDRIVNDTNYQKYAKGNEKLIERLAGNLKGVSTRTLYNAVAFYNKYPILAQVPEGKNISWSKLVSKYLPQHATRESESEYQRISKGIERWSKSIVGIINQSSRDRIDYHVREIKNILAKESEGTGEVEVEQDRSWMRQK